MSSETYSRVLVGLPIAVVLAILVLFLPVFGLVCIAAIIVGVATWEWATMHEYDGLPVAIYSAFCCVLAFVLGAITPLFSDTVVTVMLAFIAALWTAFALLVVLWHSRGVSKQQAPSFFSLFIGIPMLVLLPTYVVWLDGSSWPGALPWLGDGSGVTSGRWLLFGLLVMSALADVAAYFGGRAWGKRRLSRRLSYGKTMVGTACGLLTGMLVGTGFAVMLGIPLAVATGVCLFITMVGVMGDLLESGFKRRVSVKDSSLILGHHGGVLDRIDSHISSLPVCCVLVWFLGQLL